MTFLRYLAIQLLAYGIDMGTFLLVIHLGWSGPIGANVLAKLTAGGFAFVAHRSFTFNAAGPGFVRRQAVRYFLVLAANVPLASGVLWLIIIWVSPPVAAKFLSDVVCVALTYALSKHFIFNTYASPPGESVSGTKP